MVDKSAIVHTTTAASVKLYSQRSWVCKMGKKDGFCKWARSCFQAVSATSTFSPVAKMDKSKMACSKCRYCAFKHRWVSCYGENLHLSIAELQRAPSPFCRWQSTPNKCERKQHGRGAEGHLSLCKSLFIQEKKRKRALFESSVAKRREILLSEK